MERIGQKMCEERCDEGGYEGAMREYIDQKVVKVVP